MRSVEPEVATFFIHNKSEILTALRSGMHMGNVLGILSDVLGHGMFMCRVKNICVDEDEEDIMIVLDADGLHAGRLDEQVVYLNEIERIYPFPVGNGTRETDACL